MSKVLPARSPDGFRRSREHEDELDAIAVELFNSEGGDKFLRYMKSITNVAFLPEDSEAAMRHNAGARHLISIIDERMRRGAAKRKGS